MVWVSQVLGAGEAVTAVTTSRGQVCPLSRTRRSLQKLNSDWGCNEEWDEKMLFFFKANLKQQAEKQKNPPKDSRNKPSFIFETFFNVD